MCLHSIAPYSDFSLLIIVLKRILLSTKAGCRNSFPKDGFGDTCLHFVSVRPLCPESELGPKTQSLTESAGSARGAASCSREKPGEKKKKPFWKDLTSFMLILQCTDAR